MEHIYENAKKFTLWGAKPPSFTSRKFYPLSDISILTIRYIYQI